MLVSIGFCHDGFPFWCDHGVERPPDGSTPAVDPPPAPVPAPKKGINVWQGPNPFDCSLNYGSCDALGGR